MIRGNREEYLMALDSGTAPEHWYQSEQWAPLRWEHGQLDRATLDWIASLPGPKTFAASDVTPIHVVHGSPSSAREALYPDEQAVLARYCAAAFMAGELAPHRLARVLASLAEPVLICAHTHMPWVQERKEKLILNPGSVGAPLNGDVRAQYALLKWRGGRWQAEHRAVCYDLDRVRRVFQESGYLAQGGPYARAWLVGVETGRYVWGAFLAHARRLAAETGEADRRSTIADVWDQAVATFDWETYQRSRS
jgi:diadenosine tetraphosphatase ApaH/serine/threonine PP2A family protein phosphatase